MTYHNILFVICSFLLISCTSKISKNNDAEILQDTTTIENKRVPVISDTAFVYLTDYADGFIYDLKYATSDNFLKKSVYTCDRCIIRKEVADALIKSNDSLRLMGYRIKFYDCYRPLDVQKLMWKIYPEPGYVANPYTSGSNHNRGGAVDITLVDLNGTELNMGTPFDFFGKKAHHSYTALSDTIIYNRKLLKSIMEEFGFASIKTEWWHYNFNKAKNYTLSNFQTECD